MGKLLRFEFRRLFRSVGFYVFIGLIAALNFLIIASMSRLDLDRSNFILSSFKTIDVVLLLAIFLPIYVCRNFADGTIKTMVAKGYSMQKFYFTQLIVSLLVAVVFCAVSLISDWLFGVMLIKNSGDFKGVASSLALQFTVIIAFTCIFSSLAFSMSKTGGAIAVNVVFYMMGSLVFAIIDAVLYQILKDRPPRNWTVLQYWIGDFYEKCVSVSLSGDIISLAIIGSIVYAAIFVALGYLVSRKREL